MKRSLLAGLVVIVVIGAAVAFLALGEGGRRALPDSSQRGGTDSLSSAERAQLERLGTLGYLSGSEPVPAESGVVTYHPEASFQGPTLYSCSEGSAAILIDMDGNRAAHHDLDVLEDGTIAVLAAEEATRDYICNGKPFLTDSVVLLDPDGTPEFRAPLLESFERSPRYRNWVQNHIEPGSTDPLHANSVEVIEDHGERLALVSIRNMDTVALMHIDTCHISWAITGPWHRQHEARIVSDGILLFDNLGLGDQSRIIDYDTETDKISWSYTEPGFFTESEGAEQRLPNGNTLITESDNGRIIEVTEAGRIVWEYINPASGMLNGKEVVLVISRAQRLSPDFPTEWAVGGRHEKSTFGM
jgi:hypothetical protein